MNEDGELKKLLEENLAVAKENNQLLKLIRRDAAISLAVKIVLYLLLLGVPLFFLSTYLGPLLAGIQNGTSTAPTSLFGIPSPDEAKKLMDEYKAIYEGS